MIKHEDNRRIIYDWAQGNFKSCKAVIVKEEIPIGDHYHKNKEEHFFLVSGQFLELKIGAEISYNVSAPYSIIIPKNTYHKFTCKTGSILLCAATEFFDINDEIKL